MSVPLVIDAPAKINLGLAILGRRADGYHDLLSVFEAISWSDRLTLSRAPEGITLACPGSDLPSGPENLVWRAADLVRRRFGISRGVRIVLDKRIPAGAGLGGGSSDAAATVRGLDRLWEIGASEDELAEVCAVLGSDVPFFLRAALGGNGTAIVEGRGEIVTPLPAQETLHMVVAAPPVHVSTPWGVWAHQAAVQGGSGLPGTRRRAERGPDRTRRILPRYRERFPETGRGARSGDR